jgi:hypothetical protein
MNLTQKLVEDIFLAISRENTELSVQAIPHSDTFLKQVQSEMGVSPESARLAIKLLADSHKIFVMEIVADDSRHNIDRVEGFIIAELDTVVALKGYFQDILCKIYEKQFHKYLMVHQVIKEVFPIIKSFNNTELGQMTNKTMMLMEYERLLEKKPYEYSADWKENTLHELAQREGFTYVPSDGVVLNKQGQQSEDPSVELSSFVSNTGSFSAGGSFARAVDSPAYKEFSEKRDRYPLQRILNIYGLDFFVKVYLRKYEFHYLKKIIEDRQITRKNDLLLIKSMIDTTKSHMFNDQELEKYKEEIFALERAVSHAIYFTAAVKGAKKNS